MRPQALDDDCAQADIVVSAAAAIGCEKPRLVLDAGKIVAEGGYAVSFAPLRAIGVNQWRGARPWVGDVSRPPQ